MRLFDGKRFVASIRGNDFAHAGEEEAIDRVFSMLFRDPNRKILDIGCGQGKTAELLQDQDFGQVTGVDREEASISYANEHYSKVEFFCSDVVDIDEKTKKRFDIICAFNAFYAFPDQLQALKALKKVAAVSAELLLFDYVDYGGCRREDEDLSKIFYPIDFNVIDELLEEAGWEKTSVENLDKEYKRWYSDFLEKMKNKKTELIEEFGEDAYQYAYKNYVGLLKSIEEKKLGGCILRAKALP